MTGEQTPTLAPLDCQLVPQCFSTTHVAATGGGVPPTANQRRRAGVATIMKPRTFVCSPAALRMLGSDASLRFTTEPVAP